MRAPRRVVTVFPSLLFVVAACVPRDAGDDAVRVQIAPTLIFPKGLLDGVASLEVVVYNASDGVSCDAAGATATGVTATTPKVGSGLLGSSGCIGTARFCGSLSLQKDPGSRVFSATAKNAAGAAVADGCATAKVDQDSLSVQIKMVRHLAVDVCGDGTIGPTEQCEPPGVDGAFACDPKCHTKESLLSNPFVLASTPTGRSVFAPAFFWPTQGGFFGLFTVANNATPIPPTGPTTQVALRALSDAFAPLASPPGPAGIADGAFFLPRDTTFPPAASPHNQSQPSVTSVGDRTYVVFTDDDESTPDIHLRSFDASFAGQEGASAIGINGEPNGAPQFPPTGEPNVQEAPSVAAGPGGALLIAWQDSSGPNQGKIFARTFTPGTPGVLGSQLEISTGGQNRNAKVAAANGRWVIVWESGTDVKLRVIDANGTPSGGDQNVNDATLHQGTQDHPGVAVLSDGRFAVAWCDHGAPGGADVFLQRYDRNLVKVPGDQTVRINSAVVDGDQTAPSIAASTGAGGSYVVAWLDAASSQVRARFVGGASGFLFNNVDGQSDDFQASLATGRKRANPVVAAGGAGLVVVGWDDVTGDATGGTYGRRFPPPSQ